MSDFADLADGGRALAPLVFGRVGVGAVVLAVVPNGVPAAAEVARGLGLPMVGVRVTRASDSIEVALPDLAGFAEVVVVDDAVESGTAARAIGAALRAATRARLVLAVPVCPIGSEPAPPFDEVIAVVRPAARHPLEHHYARFEPVPLDQAEAMIAAHAASRGDAPAG